MRNHRFALFRHMTARIDVWHAIPPPCRWRWTRLWIGLPRHFVMKRQLVTVNLFALKITLGPGVRDELGGTAGRSLWQRAGGGRTAYNSNALIIADHPRVGCDASGTWGRVVNQSAKLQSGCPSGRCGTRSNVKPTMGSRSGRNRRTLARFVSSSIRSGTGPRRVVSASFLNRRTV